jgi:hypothetical protein
MSRLQDRERADADSMLGLNLALDGGRPRQDDTSVAAFDPTTALTSQSIQARLSHNEH